MIGGQYVVNKTELIDLLKTLENVLIDNPWQVNSAIIPAWHMNKLHWNTVFVNDIDLNELKELMEHSYELTK